MALVKLKNPIDKFSEDIRPLCLPFQILEKPLCPDKSYDTGINEIKTLTHNHINKIIKIVNYYNHVWLIPVSPSGEEVSGGCATVAGWGNRYDGRDDHGGNGDIQTECTTDFSSLSPDKSK